MNDRELLELAAKAAGIEYHIDTCDGCEKLVANNYGAVWNPRLDDAQALRLAVALGMSINVSEVERRISIFWCDSYTPVRPIIHQTFSDNKNSATRRAIVRAAAEIGAAMQQTEVEP